MLVHRYRAYRDRRVQSYLQTPSDVLRPSLYSASEDKDGRCKSGNSSRGRSETSKKKYDAVKLSKGQSRETTAKKGSRHADVIDRWDPTGLGHASE